MLNFWMCYFFHEGKKHAFNVFSYRAELFFSLCGTVTVSFRGSHESHEKKNVQKIPFWIIFFVPCGDQREKNYFFCFSQRILFFLIKQFCVWNRVERYIFSEKISNRKNNMWNWVKKKSQCEYFFLTFSEFLREKWRKIFSLKTQPEKENLCAEPSEFLFFMEKKKFSLKNKVEKILKKIKYICVELSKSRAECIFFLWRVIKMLHLLNCIFIRKKIFSIQNQVKKIRVKKKQEWKKIKWIFFREYTFFCHEISLLWFFFFTIDENKLDTAPSCRCVSPLTLTQCPLVDRRVCR